MKKTFLLAGLLLSGLFIACNDDDNDEPVPAPIDPVVRNLAYEAEGLYSVVTSYAIPDSTQGSFDADEFRIKQCGEGLIRITTPFIEIKEGGNGKLGTIVIDSIPVTETEEGLAFALEQTGKISTSNFENPQAWVEGSLKDGKVQAGIRLYNGERDIRFQFAGERIAFDEAKVLDVSIKHPNITAGPEVDKKTFTFYLHPETDMSRLEMAPVLTLSKGATCIPCNGVTVDFARYKDYTVNYTVIAENQSVQTYKIRLIKGGDISRNDFSNWVEEDTENHFYKPAVNWATSNPGVTMIIATGSWMGVNYEGGAIVMPEENGYTGKGAKIVTADTKGGASIMPGLFPSIPKITSGSLFTGNFDVTDVTNPLKSTQFGIPYFQKPLHVKGYFKYTPGEEYHHCPDPQKSEVTEVVPGKRDECALSAVLYEVDNFADFLHGENIFTSDKIVAIAQQFSGEVKDYTAFDLELVYRKEYDPAKKYRFAVIFSSSKDGDKFSGAPGSTLYIDEVEVVNE